MGSGFVCVIVTYRVALIKSFVRSKTILLYTKNKRLLVQQPINGVDNLEALIVAKGVAIQCDDGFGIIIVDGFQ